MMRLCGCVWAVCTALSEHILVFVFFLVLSDIEKKKKKKFEGSCFSWVKLGSVLGMRALNKLVFLLEVRQFVYSG